MCPGLGGIDLLELRAAALGDEVEAEAGCPFGRCRATTAPDHRRPAQGHRRRCHVDVAALMFEGLAGLGSQQKGELVLDELAAAPEVGAMVVELLGSVPDGQDVAHPAATDDVEHHHVLRQADRVVQRQDQRRGHDR